MQTEISISSLLTILRNAWLKILIIVLVVTLSAGIFTTFFIDKVYSSSVRFFVMNLPESSYISTAYTSGAQSLVNDYIEILKSDPMMDAVIEELATKYQITGLSRNRIRGMIKTTTTSNTAAFTVQISSTDRELAFKVSKCFASLGNKIITERSRTVAST